MAPPIAEGDAEAKIIDWVSREMGGEVVRIAGVGGGKSRAIYAIDLEREGQVLELLARQETGVGPHFGTAFTIEREGAALRTLEPAPFKKPRVFAVSEDAILMTRLKGAAEIPKDAALRRKAIASFGEELAALHRIDVASLKVHLPRPADAREGALNDLADWANSYERFCAKHPVIDDGFAWLRVNAPSPGLRPHVVHGDCGPGNFMHDQGVVTGLIDWEFTHYGDPHEDLAWLWFRVNMIHQDIELDSYFEHYLRASGLDFDRKRCLYYIIQTLLRTSISSAVKFFYEPTYGERAAAVRGFLERGLADVREGALSRLPPLPASVS